MKKQTMLEPGEPAPTFSLPDSEMEPFSLSSVRGKKHIVIIFYSRDRTPACTMLAADFSDHEDEFAKYDCIVVGISPDDCFTHAEFRDAEGLSIRLLSDPDARVAQRYHVWQEREADGIKKKSVQRATFIIDKQGILRHALYDITPRGHAAAVYELVKELESGHDKQNRQK